MKDSNVGYIRVGMEDYICLSKMRLSYTFSLLLFFAFYSSAQVTNLEELYTPDGFVDNGYGFSVSISGDYLAIGAYKSDTISTSGSVYIYKKDSNGEWLYKQKLVPSEGTNEKWFAYSLSMFENRLAVGAPDDGLPGAVYVYELDDEGSWEFAQKISYSGSNWQNRFGWSVGLSADNLVVGSPGSNEAFVFNLDENNVWGDEFMFSETDGDVLIDWFGISVGVYNDFIVIGASGYLNASGAVYVYERDGLGNWSTMQKITASDSSEAHVFGISVSIHENYLVVGSPVYYNIGDEQMGAVYVYKKNINGVWDSEQKIVPSDVVTIPWYGIGFGTSVKISNNHLVVGHPRINDQSGAIYIYSKDAYDHWSGEQKFAPSNIETNDYFGRSVDVEGNQFVVGACFCDWFCSDLKMTSAYTGLIDSGTNTNELKRPHNILNQNNPNPFKEYTQISFVLEEAGRCKISISDVNGKILKIIEDEFPSGYNEVLINSIESAGVYYYTLEFRDIKTTKKMLVIE